MPKTPRKTTRRSVRHETSSNGAAKTSARKRRPSGARKAKTKTARSTSRQIAAAALDDLKAMNITVLDVRHLTSVTDTMIVAAGRSDRHVRSIADAVVERCKDAGIVPIGVEGQDAGEWILVDLGDVVVHVMLPRVREFYNLERLWDIAAQEGVAER
jgi:ribosome-associated protein